MVGFSSKSYSVAVFFFVGSFLVCLVGPADYGFLGFFLTLCSFIFGEDAYIGGVGGVKEVMLPVVVLLLAIQVGTIPTGTFSVVMEGLPGSRRLPAGRLLYVFRSSRKCV